MAVAPLDYSRTHVHGDKNLPGWGLEIIRDGESVKICDSGRRDLQLHAFS